MASQSTQNLPEVIKHYGEVAEMVNRREMDRFIAHIRSRWNPPSHEEDYRFEGWTSEGALTKFVYETAFYSQDRPEPVVDPNGTDAEVNEQVQIKPSLDEILNYFPKPLILPPLSDDRRRELLESIKIGMKQQTVASGLDATALELPKDLEVLFSTVKGINGAGVPAETAYTMLVYGHGEYSLPDEMPLDVSLRRKRSLTRPDGDVPVAALHLGGCEQHRSIYYVLSVPNNSTEITAEAEWQIWDRFTHEVEHYDDLAEWLQHETKKIEETEGGGKTEAVLVYDRYPV